MMSIHFVKNPAAGNMYWGEVCCRDDRPHLFHARHNEFKADRKTPMSSTHAAHGSGSCVHEVTLERKDITRAGPNLGKSLTAAAQNTLAMTPREKPSPSWHKYTSRSLSQSRQFRELSARKHRETMPSSSMRSHFPGTQLANEEGHGKPWVEPVPARAVREEHRPPAGL
mmetsp:Transcript_107208/g.201831  ORF Transcript_107208/g.201831 Transcript_107208/m.201831 type:complete len:169 (-) Transcript_107208:54-560(-)